MNCRPNTCNTCSAHPRTNTSVVPILLTKPAHSGRGEHKHPHRETGKHLSERPTSGSERGPVAHQLRLPLPAGSNKRATDISERCAYGTRESWGRDASPAKTRQNGWLEAPVAPYFAAYFRVSLSNSMYRSVMSCNAAGAFQDFAFGGPTFIGPKVTFRGPKITPPQNKKVNGFHYFLKDQNS